MLDRILGITRNFTGRLTRGGPPSSAHSVESLEQRISHLETMVEGLQDAVHREATRTNHQIDELRHRTEPAELSRALSKDARNRGL